MRRGADLHGAALKWLLLALCAIAGCFDAVVGYPCATGFSTCGELCVDLQSSTANCGACGQTCAGVCVAGSCQPAIDGGAVDGPEDASNVDAATDAGPSDRPVDKAPVDAPAVVDAPPADASQTDASPDTAIACDGGMTVCGSRCVLLDRDPDNCGGCGKVCTSGLCMGSVCQAEGVGHLVVIGHDFIVNRAGMNNLIGNAVLLTPSNQVTVLAYEGAARPGAIAGANAAIDQVTAARGRAWTRTTAAAGQVAALLSAHDVFLIYAQEMTDDTGLIQLGKDWASALTAFLTGGKTVILLDGESARHGGTYQIAEAAGLITVDARAVVTGDILTVVAPGDAVSLNVPRNYRAEMTSVAFDSPDTVRVVASPGGDAVVIHRIY